MRLHSLSAAGEPSSMNGAEGADDDDFALLEAHGALGVENLPRDADRWLSRIGRSRKGGQRYRKGLKVAPQAAGRPLRRAYPQ